MKRAVAASAALPAPMALETVLPAASASSASLKSLSSVRCFGLSVAAGTWLVAARRADERARAAEGDEAKSSSSSSA